ncbi:hypothetical protein DPMN_079216 [Dreissena polymorpha]|uniref:Uncharacterized protein n=1 Tax=Dreissena polymorpha TaxID=45954 RepID=A0A9D4BI72_DREPO|nr:hypothetical protein DPMN_079216 [Dreissena polymorpha]
MRVYLKELHILRGDKIFAGKTFVLYGFDEEGIPALTAYIKEGGGVVLQTSDRHIPDYAIVPMDGFPVDWTVINIVTNTWMNFCPNDFLAEFENRLQEVKK